MRTLRFHVNGQVLTPDPNCNFSGLIPGAKGCIQADFTFSDEWSTTPKVVGFYSRLGREYPPCTLEDGRTCLIPEEALGRQYFKIMVIGKNGLVTNKLTIKQEGGCV